MRFKVRDLKLAGAGMKKIEWARAHMPVLEGIKKMFARKKPLRGIRVGACLHVTKETAVLMETLRGGGASVALCGSNPLSTQDDVAAALAREGIAVFAWRGLSQKEYYWCMNKVLDTRPHIMLDDGADLISTLHSKRRELLSGVIGSQEETTTGVTRLRAMARDGALEFPVIAVNDTPTKRLIDNAWGTAESTLDAIMRTTNILLAGKNFVVAGFGYCGRGLAIRASGMGANVIVTETDPMKALEAHLFGFRVMPMRQAARIGDFFVTVTGGKNAITKKHFLLMKDGAVLANAGHFDVEINVNELNALAVKKRNVLPNVEEYTLKNGRRLYLLAEGRLVNLAAGSGHSSLVMDTSFSDQALCTEYLLKYGKKLGKGVHEVPGEIDELVAKLKLKTEGIEIDSLTTEQKRYLLSWTEGT